MNLIIFHHDLPQIALRDCIYIYIYLNVIPIMYLFYPKTMSIYFPQQNQDEYQAAGTSKVKVFTAFFRSMAALENITFLQHIHTVGMGGMMGNG